MLDEDMYEAIGEVTVAAATLEYQLAYLIALARGEDDDWLRSVLSSPGKVREQLKRLINDVEPGSFRDDLRRLERDAVAVLDDRHVLVHSVAMVDREDDGSVVWSFWHPRSDREARIDAPAILEHAADIRSRAARALRHTKAAAEWQTAHARPGDESP